MYEERIREDILMWRASKDSPWYVVPAKAIRHRLKKKDVFINQLANSLKVFIEEAEIDGPTQAVTCSDLTVGQLKIAKTLVQRFEEGA